MTNVSYEVKTYEIAEEILNKLTELIEIIDACRDVAEEYADSFIPLDGIFAASRLNDEWTKYVHPDGVHPEDGGKRLIAKYVVQEIKRLTGI